MKKISRRRVSKGLAAAAVSILARPAIAQGAYPAGVGTIKLVVPYPAGGATDVIGRIVADRLSALWNASVIVENIAGAAANIGMDRVAKGPTDGSTLFMVPPQIAINQYLYAKLAFDPGEGPRPDLAGCEPAEHPGGEEAAHRDQDGQGSDRLRQGQSGQAQLCIVRAAARPFISPANCSRP